MKDPLLCRVAAFVVCIVLNAVSAPSFAMAGNASCVVSQQTRGGTLEIEQDYDGAGAPKTYKVAFAAEAPTEVTDGGRFRIAMWLLGAGALGDSAAARIDEHAVFEFHLMTNTELQRPAVLFFSRANYINIDLGLGKIFQPGQVDANGELETMDTYDRWVRFAEDEHVLTWVLQDVDHGRALLDSGTIDLDAMRDVRNATLALLDRLGKRDIRTGGPVEGARIDCV